MKTTIKTRFNIGDEINSIFWDDNIGAWNTESFFCGWVRINITEEGQRIEYGRSPYEDCGTSEDEELFSTGLAAANEAKRRNLKLNQPTTEWKIEEDEDNFDELDKDVSLELMGLKKKKKHKKPAKKGGKK